jgi:hypothetical protein
MKILRTTASALLGHARTGLLLQIVHGAMTTSILELEVDMIVPLSSFVLNPNYLVKYSNVI